jgi:hypothetical protein
MFSICREFGIPRPLTQYRIEAGGRTFYADFCWPDVPLVVEFDSWRWHGGRTRTEYDRDRDQVVPSPAFRRSASPATRWSANGRKQATVWLR